VYTSHWTEFKDVPGIQSSYNLYLEVQFNSGSRFEFIPYHYLQNKYFIVNIKKTHI